MDDMKEALRIIQSLEPPGVGARNLQECLILQLDKRDKNYRLIRDLLLNHLEDIEMKKYPLIARKTGQKLGVIKKQVEFIRTLNPKPGSIFCDETIPYVVPEGKVEYIDGRYEVFLIDNTNLPHLHISAFYKKYLGENGTDNTTRQYIQKKNRISKMAH